jgi:hypothetical protein
VKLCCSAIGFGRRGRRKRRRRKRRNTTALLAFGSEIHFELRLANRALEMFYCIGVLE